MVTPLVPVKMASTVCKPVVEKKSVPPPVVLIVPPPRTSFLNVKPLVLATVSSVLLVPVTVTFVAMAAFAPVAVLRIVPPVQLKRPVRRLLEMRPVPELKTKVPPERLYVLTCPLMAAVLPRLSRTTQGVVIVPPVWLRTPTPSTPT